MRQSCSASREYVDALEVMNMLHTLPLPLCLSTLAFGSFTSSRTLLFSIPVATLINSLSDEERVLIM